MKNVTVIIDTRVQRFKMAWAFIVGAFWEKDVMITDIPDDRISGA